MTVAELIKELEAVKDKSKKIQIGCEGYTTADDPDDEYEINIYTTRNNVFIVDSCGGYPIPNIHW